MINSLAPTTLKQYQVTYKLWWTYCNQKGVTLFCAIHVDILSFVHHLLDKSAHKYGTFNSHRSALALPPHNDVGNNIYIKLFWNGLNDKGQQSEIYNNLGSRNSSSVSGDFSSCQWTLTKTVDLPYWPSQQLTEYKPDPCFVFLVCVLLLPRFE